MITFKKFDLREYRDCLIVTDENIAKLYGIAGDNVYLLPQGEEAKSFAEAEKLCSWFLSKNLPRSGRIAAIGGGSVGDVTGFAAGVYKRGVKLTHVPTTLVAQIDSSVGGKTAVNVGTVKNAAGTFYAADTVIDVGFLQTLDELQLKNGLGELLKYRMLCAEIEGISSSETVELVKACVSYKSAVCKTDPYDLNERRKLNFGHTIGHAMELSLRLSHGVAVANGLYYETLLACKMGKCGETYFLKWVGEIKNNFEIYPLTDEILNLTLCDKKNDGVDVGFVLPCDFEFVKLPLNKVKSFLL